MLLLCMFTLLCDCCIVSPWFSLVIYHITPVGRLSVAICNSVFFCLTVAFAFYDLLFHALIMYDTYIWICLVCIWNFYRIIIIMDRKPLCLLQVQNDKRYQLPKPTITQKLFARDGNGTFLNKCAINGKFYHNYCLVQLSVLSVFFWKKA